MGSLPILVALAALAAGGCYAPDLRDCSVTCTGADECSGDQVCSAGFCAADGVSCMGGGVTTDAPAVITLRVDVEGAGKVVVEGVGECHDDDNTCTWMVPAGQLRFEAREIEDDKEFDRWTTLNCPQSTQSTCTVTLATSATVGARFK